MWRDNSRRVRTHEKNSGETVCRLGKGLFCPYLKTFVPPFLPDWLPLGLRGWNNDGLTWEVKCENLTQIKNHVGNLLDIALEIVHEWNGYLEIFSFPQAVENSRQFFASPNRYFTENSHWIPLFQASYRCSVYNFHQNKCSKLHRVCLDCAEVLLYFCHLQVK